MGKYSYSDAKTRAEKHASGFDSTSIKLPEGVKRWKPKKAGVYKIDIIPFVAGKGNPYAEEGVLHYERTFYVHPRLGGDGDTYVCPKESAGKPCPICELRNELKAEGDSSDKLIKSLYPKERQLFQVIDLAEPEKGIQIYENSYHNFGKLLDERIKNADEADEVERTYKRFYHITKGKTLKVTFSEEPMDGGKTFLKATAIDFRDRVEAYDDDIIEKGHCLDEFPIIEEYDTLKDAMNSGKKKKPADDEDAPPAKKKPAPVDDEDAPPPRKKPTPPADDEDETPPPKKKPAPAKDEEDDDWPDTPPPKKKPVPADDEDEAPPAKKKPAPPAEDEDDPPPAKKPSKPAPKDDDWD